METKKVSEKEFWKNCLQMTHFIDKKIILSVLFSQTYFKEFEVYQKYNLCFGIPNDIENYVFRLLIGHLHFGFFVLDFAMF